MSSTTSGDLVCFMSVLMIPISIHRPRFQHSANFRLQVVLALPHFRSDYVVVFAELSRTRYKSS